MAGGPAGALPFAGVVGCGGPAGPGLESGGTKAALASAGTKAPFARGGLPFADGGGGDGAGSAGGMPGGCHCPTPIRRAVVREAPLLRHLDAPTSWQPGLRGWHHRPAATKACLCRRLPLRRLFGVLEVGPVDVDMHVHCWRRRRRRRRWWWCRGREGLRVVRRHHRIRGTWPSCRPTCPKLPWYGAESAFPPCFRAVAGTPGRPLPAMASSRWREERYTAL